MEIHLSHSNFLVKHIVATAFSRTISSLLQDLATFRSDFNMHLLQIIITFITAYKIKKIACCLSEKDILSYVCLICRFSKNITSKLTSLFLQHFDSQPLLIVYLRIIKNSPTFIKLISSNHH